MGYPSIIRKAIFGSLRQSSKTYHDSLDEISKFFNTSSDQIAILPSTEFTFQLVLTSLPTNYSRFITSIFDPVQLISPIIQLKPEKHLWIETEEREEINEFLRSNVDANTVVILNDLSPVFGNTRDIEGFAKLIHSKGGLLIVDLSRITNQLDMNFVDIAFIDGHVSLLGPMGVSLLFVNSKIIDKLNIKSAGPGTVNHIDKTQLKTVLGIEKFEISPPNIPALLGLVESIKFLKSKNIQEHISHLIKYLISKLNSIEHVKILTNLNHELNSSLVFNIENIDLLDLTIMIDEMYDIELYSGQLCSKLALDKLGINSVLMASVHIYNTIHDIDQLVIALIELIEMLK
jgi:selenocysteine lyase/cysteine desulfurase